MCIKITLAEPVEVDVSISEKSKALYQRMVGMGYPKDFVRIVASELNTEFTATRMLGYLSRAGKVSMEELADEMFAIISDRDRIRDKHINEYAQSKVNAMYRNQ